MQFAVTRRTRVRRLPKRSHYDQNTIYPIIDAALICHVGFVQAGQPFVIPTLHARRGDQLLLHGASSSRLMRHAAAGHELCLTFTLVDGLVLARSVFHHSVNYRSVVLFGRGRPIEAAAKKAALQAFTERLLPGRWQDARRPNVTELKATAVVAVPITEAVAKVRSGPPVDDAADLDLPVWAGVLPFGQVVQEPVPVADQDAAVPVPDYIRDYVAARRP